MASEPTDPTFHPGLFPDGTWRVALDTGGTFTDAIAIAPDGSWRRAKVPSDGSIRCRAWGEAGGRELALELPAWVPAPARFAKGLRVAVDGEAIELVEAVDVRKWRIDRALPRRLDGDPVAIDTGLDAPIVAVHALLGVAPGDDLPPIELRLATTRGTNALFEGRGAAVGLIVSRGFADLLAIGDQSRPDLFDLAIRKPAPLAIATVAVDERRLADGSVRAAPTREAIAAAARQLRGAGATAIAVAFLHALRDPAHEERAVAWLREEGIDEPVAASVVSDSPRYLTRAETAVAHATIAPVIRDFLGNVAARLRRARIFVLTSAGGLQGSERFLARDCLLSGPAGGVAGIAEVARRTKTPKVLGLDMGGTSADVARFDGEFHYRYETRVGAARVAAPSLVIESVAAGGGSICSVARGELRVGPESAGARPGPACYGFGGPLTLTDVNLLLGRMDPARATVPLSLDAARAALGAAQRDFEAQRRERIDADALLRGFLAVADERMSAAIEAVSLRHGEDPREYALVPFGGAGGQHACAIAEQLGIESIVFPVDAGLLSARGLLGANVERIARGAVLEPLGRVAATLERRMQALVDDATRHVRADVGADAAIVAGPRVASLKLVGQDAALEVTFGDEAALRRGFAAAFERTYGYPPPPRELEVEALTAIMRADASVPRFPHEGDLDGASGAVGATPVFERGRLRAGATIEGPALLVDAGSTAHLGHGWSARVLPDGDVVATRTARERASAEGGAADVDLFACRLEAMAVGMGEALRRTALSTNVKERLDFSCAILDRDGTLAVNAPHLPVHLGALGVCVRGVAKSLALKPGDVAITNHPAFGGSHLPDVTVITPVFEDSELIGYVANRAHHAEIGGTRPGSFPPDATCLADEGVVIAPMLLIDGGANRFDRLESLLRDDRHPSRAVAENLADVQAAVAANAYGARALTELARRHGRDGLRQRFAAILERAEKAMASTLAALPAGERVALERLDDGAPLSVRVTIEPRGAARIDFTGSAPQRRDGFNAPLAVVRAATLYCLRLLIGTDIPMNEGLLRRIELVVPDGMLNPRFDADPRRCPPVVAGNVETSQRVTDTLLKAFGLAACSQGTMNNLLFGNDAFGMYETIAGGSGATRGADGADAVHTNMTNTRITDAEVLERRCPVVVREFAIRRGSGGAGGHRGGDGSMREIEFLQAVKVSLLSQHRVEAPYGIDGGEPGARGRQWVVRRDGGREAIDGVAAVDLETGEAIRVETPGGGGCLTAAGAVD